MVFTRPGSGPAEVPPPRVAGVGRSLRRRGTGDLPSHLDRTPLPGLDPVASDLGERFPEEE